MNKTLARALWFLLGLGFVACLLWVQSPDVSRTPVPAEKSRDVAPPQATPPVVAAARSASADFLAQLDALLRSSEARAREALLTFKDEAGLERFLTRASAAGLTVLGQLPGLRSVRVRYPKLYLLQDELLAHANDYSDLSANFLVSIPAVPAREDRAAANNVPFGNRTLEYLGVDQNVDASAWGRGVTIAVLDSGVGSDATFGTNRLSALDIGLGLTPEAGGEAGHGTAVASLAAGAARDAAGVAPGANILSIRVTDASGVSDLFTLSNAIVAAVDAGAKVVNISLGGYATAPILDAAISYAGAHGAVIVAAGGNDQAAQLAWPAADPRVVSVGAIDAAEQQVSFSNSGQQLRLTAPGYGVQSAWSGGERVFIDGTSASAPLVAGAIAALMSQNPTLTAAQAVQLLTKSASDGGAPGADPAFGNGILNLAWAMNTNTAGYVDTAISSHFYDQAKNELDIVIQNRGTQIITGPTLSVVINGAPPLTYRGPSLTPGQSWTAAVPADPMALKHAGQLTYTSQLENPPGVIDARPANNKRSTVLLPPAKQ